MMKRNTILMAGLLVLGLLASCKKDNNAVVGQGFVAQTEQGSGSRTHGVSDGSNIAVLWSTGDQILVANGDGSTLTYTLKRGANSTEATFASIDETDEFFQPNYVAIYPATNANNEANTIQQTADGVSAVFNLPATQTYRSNSFGEKAVPMVAYSESEELQFKNVLGGVCFPIFGDGLVTKIVLTSNADEALWGTCTTTISTEGDVPVSTVSNTATNKNVITLDCGGGYAVGTNPKDFYIMVPVGTLTAGFNLKVYNGDDVLYEHDATANTLTVSRNQVLKLENPIEVHALIPGALNGTFTSNAQGNKILFSKGSLRYNPAQDIWRFAEPQYNFLHSASEGWQVDVSSEYQPDYDGWIELFGWGCTGQQDLQYHSNQQYYMPYDTYYDPNNEELSSSYYGPTGEHDLSIANGSDWGALSIENGGGYGWRLWDMDEALYIINERETESGIRFAWVKIGDEGDGIDDAIGLIILPDEWDSDIYPLRNTNTFIYDDLNLISIDDWNNILEPNGVMFMITPGARFGTTLDEPGRTYGFYWSRTASGDACALVPNGPEGTHNLEYRARYRYMGGTVRLIRDVQQ